MSEVDAGPAVAPAIDARGLTKRYAELTAVDGIDVELAPGRILGLVGPNGAGKTTTLHCLCGVLRPDEGQVTIAGVDLLAQPEAAKRLLAYIPDTPQLFEYLTVEQHLQFVARLYGVAEWREPAEALLREFEIEDKREVLPHELSRGMKQKLAICCGLLHRPRVLLFDEPLTGLDPIGIRAIKASIRRRATAEGVAVIISSHQLELVHELSDELMILRDGRLLTRGTPRSLRERYGDLGAEASLEELFFRALADPPPESVADPAASGPAA